MGKKRSFKPNQVLIFLLILSLSIPTQLVESQTKEEQVLIISDLEGLDNYISPFTSGVSTQWMQVINTVGASLYTKYAPSTNIEHDYLPQLAESDPIISTDGQTFTIKLKPNLKFSNGNSLTSKDVVFSYNLYLTPNINRLSSRWLSNYISSNSSVTSIDELTLKFDFEMESPFNFEILSQSPIIESSEDNLQKFNNCVSGKQTACDWSNSDGRFMIGAGPYMIESHDIENQEIQLVKNPYYHNYEIWADRLIIRSIGGDNSATGEVDKEEADVIFMATSRELAARLDDTPYELFFLPHSRVVTIDLNMLHPIFGTGEGIPDDGENVRSSNNLIQAKDVRTAISHAMDRDYFKTEVLVCTNDLLKCKTASASAAISALALGFNASIVPHEFSLEIAKQYIELAGFDFNKITDVNSDGDYSDENDTRFFDFEVTIPPDPQRIQFLNYSAIQLSKIGIGLNLDVRSPPSLLDRTFLWPNNTLVPIYDEGGVDAAMWNYGYSQPFSPEGLYNSKGLCTNENSIYRCANYANYINAEYDALVDELEHEGRDWGRRQELVSQMHQILHEELPSIPIVYFSSPVPIKKDVTMPDATYSDSSIIRWELARKEGWKAPIETGAGKDNPEISDSLILIIIGILVITLSSGLLLKRKYFT